MRAALYTMILLFAVMSPPLLAADSDPSSQCRMCHGEDGNSPTSNIPSIAGITKSYFRHVMDAYKNKGRPSEIMKRFVHDLDDASIEKLADFYSRQKWKKTAQSFDPAKAKKGKQLHLRYCEKCHENSGRSSENNFGLLAGQWTDYLRAALQAYQDKTRRVNPMMLTKLKRLQDEAGKEGIEDVLNYYASLSQ